MQRRILCALVVALSAAAAPSGEARSQALPGWSIADICAKESAPGQCAAFEGLALKAVSAIWPFVLDPIKQHGHVAALNAHEIAVLPVRENIFVETTSYLVL